MDTREPGHTLAEQHLDMLFERPRFSPLSYLLMWSLLTLFLVAIVAPHIPLLRLLAWLVLHCVAVSIVACVQRIRGGLWVRIRSYLARVVPLATPSIDSPVTRLQVLVFVACVPSITMAMSLVFFPALPMLERICQTFLFMLIAGGAALGSSGHRPLMYATVIPTMLPLGIIWLAVPPPEVVTVLRPGTTTLVVELALLLAIFGQHAALLGLRRINEQTLALRVERAELVRALRASLEQAEAANRAKTRFLASASHDLRQPIHAVSLFAAALERRPLDARSQEIARCINLSLQDLSVELNALLDISKLDAGTLRAELSSVGLLPLLSRLRDVFGAAAHAKGLQLRLECPADAWTRTDRNLLERILRNLLDNAIKYTDAGSVEIKVEALPSTYRLSITDTGCGIPEAELEHVFEEFYQVGNASRDRRCGLGLGLSIVKRLAELLGMPLQMHSSVRQGTVFDLELAKTSSNSMPQTLRSSQHPHALPAARVLVVDDEEAVREAMRALLEELGCRVTVACGTEAALRVIEAEPPDILIADFRLQCQDSGLATIEAARARIPSLPVMLITGDSAPDRLREAHTAGIAVLHKPVGEAVLKEAIARLLGDADPSNKVCDAQRPQEILYATAAG